jgi:hypothetical protein
MQKFRTTDLILASTLAYFGQSLIEVNKNIRGEVEFIFHENSDLKEIVNQFNLSELQVSPRRFAVVLKDMKKILYTQKNCN